MGLLFQSQALIQNDFLFRRAGVDGKEVVDGFPAIVIGVSVAVGESTLDLLDKLFSRLGMVVVHPCTGVDGLHRGVLLHDLALHIHHLQLWLYRHVWLTLEFDAVDTATHEALHKLFASRIAMTLNGFLEPIEHLSGLIAQMSGVGQHLP